MEEEQVKSSAAQASPLSGILSTLLSNPDLLRQVGNAVNATREQTDDTCEAGKEPETEKEIAGETSESRSVSAVPMQDGLASLLANPAMLEKLPQMLAVMKPLMSMPTPKSDNVTIRASAPEQCREQLLLSLKPFLSPARCEAVDTIIRISKLGHVLEQLK